MQLNCQLRQPLRCVKDISYEEFIVEYHIGPTSSNLSWPKSLMLVEVPPPTQLLTANTRTSPLVPLPPCPHHLA